MDTRFLKTEAVVLNSTRFGEGHKVVHLFTREKGKIEASAFGVRKTKSRFGSKLEPFTISAVLLYRKNEESMYSIKEADLIKANNAIREDLFRFVVGSSLIEPIVKFVPKAEPDPSLYFMLSESLAILNELEVSRCIGFLSVYNIKLLAILGYSPDISRCTRCGGALKEGSKPVPVVYCDQIAGFPLCKSCRTASSLKLHEGTCRFIHWAQTHQINDVNRITITESTQANIREVIELIYLHTFQKKLQSWKQLEMLEPHK